LVKLMMARSGCFRVVDRGATSEILKAERALAKEGALKKGSNMGGGQMEAADYIINAQIVHNDANAGGGGAGLGGLLPGRVGAAAGLFRVKRLESQVMLTVTNVRSSVQEAIVEGSASKSDIGIGGLAWIGNVAGGGGVYDRTDIGKITAVAFLDAHNKLVTQLGGIPVGSANVDNAGYVTSADINFRTGPSPNAPVIGKLYEGTSIILTGIKNGSWWEIEAIGKTGWVHSDYITR
jgi:curli biogenesis system outer membrane secretion channel CsgG